ncbi:hypothetical protein ACFVH0_00440 [Streptomyces sp. NPDC127117]|uniref:hypothetical protein n=1 Tax=Streptomyces sp. NPDC127117 TaxID=3345368 RepID=UPI00363091D9
MAGDQGDEFADLAHSLVQALDAWAACVGEPISKDKPTRKALVRALEQERATPEWASRAPIDGPMLSYWLRGRRQLLPGTKYNRLPSVEDSDAIARALKPHVPDNAERLPMIGREIADLARRFQATAGRGWRRRVTESSYVHSPGQAEPEEPAALRAHHEPIATPEPEPTVIVEAEIAERSFRPPRKMWVEAGALTIAAAVATGLWVWPGGEKPTTTTDKGPDRSASQSARAMRLGGPEAVASTTPGGLKGNHRCGRLRSAGAVSWKPCMTVTDEALTAFLVQFTNTSGKPMRVKTKLAYVQAAVEQACPAPWGTSVTLTIPARSTRISPLNACAVSLTPVQAFQTKAWVVPHDATQWGYREHSPTLHVQEAGTPVWADQA